MVKPKEPYGIIGSLGLLQAFEVFKASGISRLWGPKVFSGMTISGPGFGVKGFG